jgi:tetratricopeptide (TPR) repeat protein/energy-coupling factor transporter ATP-binding protein EcfA2
MATFTPHEAPAKDINALPLPRPERPVGRDEVLKEVYGLVRANTPVLLHGAPGMGKTSLAAALAAAYTQQPGGVLWLNDDTQPLSSLLVRIGRAYNNREISNSDQPGGTVGAVAALLAQHKPFIVLDNIADAFVMQQFVEKCAGNLPMVIISETELEGPWKAIALHPLHEDDAVMLFKQKAGIADNRFDADISAIARQLQNRPYALALTARALVAAKQTPAQFNEVVAGVARANNGHPDMTAIAISYRSLNNALQGLILVLGATFRGEASAELLATVSKVPSDVIEQAVGILSQLYLIEKFTRYGQPYYRLHQLVAEYAQRTLKGSNRLASLQAQVRDGLLAYVDKHSAPGAADHDRLAAEMDNILALAHWASNQGDRDTPNQLVTALLRADDFFKERGYLHDLLTLRDLGSGSRSAFPAYGDEPLTRFDQDDEDDLDEDLYDEEDEELDDEDEDIYADEENLEDVEDDEQISQFRRSLLSEPDDDLDAETADDLIYAAPPVARPPLEPLRAEPVNPNDIESLRSALHQARQARDTQRQAQLLASIGRLQVAQNKTTEAVATYNDLLSLQDSQDDSDGLVDTLDMLSSLLVKTGSSQAAVMHATRGAQLAESANLPESRISLLMTLGDARQDLGESQAAVAAFSQALELTRRHDDKQHEALALYKLGYAYLDSGDPERAIHTWEQARELFRAQLKRDYEGRVMGGLGTAYAEQERWSEAIQYYKSALFIAREVGDREEEGLHLSNLAQALVEAGQLPEALMTYRQALHLAYLSDDRDEIVSAIVDLVRLMTRSKRLLSIAQLLIQDAENLEPHDRDVMMLSRQIEEMLAAASAAGVAQSPVTGTARDYAANAYALLEG